jgi:signal transduction histidine kinase
MSLRSKIIFLYLTLALAPMVGLGVAEHVNSVRALSRLVESKLEGSTEQAAAEIAARYNRLSSQLLLIAESPFAHGLFTAAEDGVEAGVLTLPADAARGFRSVQFRDSTGGLLRSLAGDAGDAGGAAFLCQGAAATMVEVTVPVRPVSGVHGSGTVVGTVSIDRVLPAGQSLQSVFGESGFALVADRRTGVVLFDSRCPTGPPARAVLGGRSDRPVFWAGIDGGRGMFTYRDDESDRTASFVNLVHPDWTMLEAASVSDCTMPYARMRFFHLGVVLFLALAVGGAFFIMIGEVMRSLEELTSAAGRIGEGDFSPWLPPPVGDEVGTLSHAMASMLARLGTAMRQHESARQLALVGEMTSQLSHEIRNPLSSIKLNLQSVDREVRRGEVPADLPEVMRLCIGEINRLDRAVQTVLRLGRPRALHTRSCSLHALVEDTLDLMAPRLDESGITLATDLAAPADLVDGDAEQLKGVFMNLLVNAADAQASGGSIHVWSEIAGNAHIRLHVADDGPGIPPESRELIFQPFFTTKANGSGIGLALAHQTMEAHGGRVYLEKRSELERGTEFVVEMPLETPRADGQDTPSRDDDDANGRRSDASRGDHPESWFDAGDTGRDVKLIEKT